MSSLMSLTNEAQRLAQQLIDNDGELTEQLELELIGNSGQIAEKVDRYYYLQKYLEKQEEYYKALELEAKQGKQVMARAQDQLKERLLMAMDQLGASEIYGNAYRYKLQKAKPKLIIEVEAHELPERYRIVETITQANKDAIRHELESGTEIAGCKLEATKFIKAYLNTKE